MMAAGVLTWSWGLSSHIAARSHRFFALHPGVDTEIGGVGIGDASELAIGGIERIAGAL